MILVNKRRAMELFPESVTKLWNEWELRALVLLSLFLQIVLILLGNRRKYIASNWVRIIIWLAYLAADWIAAVCIGVLSNENGDDNSSQPNSLIWAFWAPFLLLHLGGPDTITAYSLEDNELWLRHFLALVIQFGGTFYIFLRSWKSKLLNILAIPIFVAGLIKYGERTWVLRSASSEQFRDALLPRPDPGPNYPKFMDEYTSGKAEGYQVSIQQRGKTSRTVHSPPEGDILQQAYYFFETFKGLFADIILSSQRRKRSQSFFQGKHSEQVLEVTLKVAFEVVEIELGFMYDVLYTKATVTCSRWGSLLRSISLSFTISAFIAFLTIDRQEYSTIDVIITYLLLVGAIVLEIYAILVLLFSDWTKRWSSKNKNTAVQLIIKAISRFQLRFLFPTNQRWSKTMAQYNLIDFCLKPRPIKVRVLQKFHIYQIFEKYYHKNLAVFSEEMKKLIFEYLVEISKSASDIEAGKQLCTGRGDLVLLEKLGLSNNEDFSHSILLWHIATDLCYENDAEKNPDCKACKVLSDYMLYLLVMCPFMLPDGIGEIRYRDSCAEAKEFFKDRKHIKSRTQACKDLLRVSTEFPASQVKGDRSKSLLFDACRLAKSLQSREHKWELMRGVWVEMLCYAASQCRPNQHAKQLRRGGELLTHVWLLMAHLDVRENFQISQGNAKGGIIVS